MKNGTGIECDFLGSDVIPNSAGHDKKTMIKDPIEKYMAYLVMERT